MGVNPVAIDRHRGAVWQNLRKNPASSLPAQAARMYGAEQEVILAITYVVVTFSMLVQGLTIGPVTRRWLATPVLVRRRARRLRVGGYEPTIVEAAPAIPNHSLRPDASGRFPAGGQKKLLPDV